MEIKQNMDVYKNVILDSKFNIYIEYKILSYLDFSSLMQLGRTCKCYKHKIKGKKYRAALSKYFEISFKEL